MMLMNITIIVIVTVIMVVIDSQGQPDLTGTTVAGL